jgi:cytochrome c-type protein NapC
MSQPTNTLIAVILVSIALAALLIFDPGITGARGGKVPAFVALFVAPVLSGWMGYSAHMEKAKATSFCLECQVMEDFGKSLHVDDPNYIPAMHFQNHRIPADRACYTCHSDYTMFGGFRNKIRGLKHVWIYYLGNAPKPEAITLFNQPFDTHKCLTCHLGARSFEEGPIHNLDPGRLEAIKSTKLSCLSSNCHSVVHNVKDIGTWKYWNPGKKP